MYVLFFAERVQKTRSSCACYQQNKQQEGCQILEKRKKYRLFLYVLLICSMTALIICWLFLIWEKIPRAIHIRAGVRQDLDLNVPVSGKLYKAPSDTADGDEAIPVTGMSSVAEKKEPKSLSVDLADSLTLYAEDIDTYTMDLKLFGLIPFKSVNVQVINDKTLIPAGVPIGIYVKTEGILVIATGDFTGVDGQLKEPVGHLLKEGDYILKADGKEVEGKAAFMRQIEESNGEEMVLTILREDQEFDLKVKPEENKDGQYKLGIWIRDNAQGVGTLTYIDENNSFGALGHGINDMDTATLMNLRNGSLYQTEIVSITKGENGTPGELTGVIDYKESNKMGTIEANTVEGIFGELNDSAAAHITSQAMPIGLKQEVETGPAQILCSVGGEPKLYDIKITAIHLDHDNINRGIELQVTDRELLETTGGIVQGMSGSPISQDGKIIGAVTHVLVQDPTRGFGIFIENMLLQ